MKFINKYPNKRYVITPTTTVEVAGRPVTKPGKSVEFANGELVTNDKETIAHLKGHIDFGVSMFTEEEKKTTKEE
jgi:hypothetical protein